MTASLEPSGLSASPVISVNELPLYFWYYIDQMVLSTGVRSVRVITIALVRGGPLSP